MKRTILALGIAIGLLLSASGCGGQSNDEQTASKSIAKVLAGTKATKAGQKIAACLSNKLVNEAGLEQLRKDKVVDKKLVAAPAIPSKLSKKSAEAYGDAVVGCVDYKALKGDIKKQSGATSAKVDAYVKCFEAIDEKDLKQAIVDRYTQPKQTAMTTKIGTATQACSKKLSG